MHIPGKILNIIRVGVYELIFCPQAKEYVIICEAVEYAKHIANTKGSGFVNAILRQTQKHIINRQKPAGQSSLRKLIPQTPNTGCEFDIEMLPDPDKLPCEYLACAFSLAHWLVQSWLDEYGRQQTEKICFASNRRPSVYLRPNPLKTTAKELAEKLKAAEVECEIEPESQMIKLTSPKAITALPGFNDGLFTVQDLASSQAVRALKPQPDWTILDLCAAPGTKTTQLAEATGGRAKIVATDIDANRLKMVGENITRLGWQDVSRQSNIMMLKSRAVLIVCWSMRPARIPASWPAGRKSAIELPKTTLKNLLKRRCRCSRRPPVC